MDTRTCLFVLACSLTVGAQAAVKDKVAILVHEKAFEALRGEIREYKSDVEKRFPVSLSVVKGSWTKPDQVRLLIKSLHRKSGITGVVLVGAIPMHRFHMHDFDNPNPLYYEDFDLQFRDQNQDGIPESYVGTPKLKVWVANLRGVEGESDEGIPVLRKFFRKTHAYYSGKQPVEDRALAVTDSDWPEGANIFSRNVGQKLFGEGGVDVLNCKGATPTTIYGAFAKHTYSMFYVQLHSTPTVQDTCEGSLFSRDIEKIKTGALFTVNHGCSNANWMKNQSAEKGRNTGMSWVFGEGVGQALVGNVRTGMVYGQDALYERILAGDYLGKAYFALKSAAEDEMNREYTKGDTVAGVLFIGNPFLVINPKFRSPGR
ncbi:MAG: hypothetical protein JST35_07560 [Armatimonadetes bacterium]|nr:hypothetical protein [Armatimonadota bacterium]